VHFGRQGHAAATFTAAALGFLAIFGAAAAAANFPGRGFLPDNRAWEMVSPADKNGGDILIDTSRVRMTLSDAERPMAAMFSSLTAFAGATGTANATDYTSARTLVPGTQGWSTHAVTALQEPLGLFQNITGGESLYVGDPSSDLTEAVFNGRAPLPGTPSNGTGRRNLYLRTDLRSPGEGSYRVLTACTYACPLPPEESESLPSLIGGSADFSRILFESFRPITPGSPVDEAAPKLFKDTDGAVEYVGYIPPFPATSCVGVEPGCAVAPRAVAGIGGESYYAPHVLSKDGARVFFTVGPDNNVPVRGDLYMRDDQGTPTAEDDTTVQINASERTVPDLSAPATYWDATPAGDRAFFTTQQALTDEAPVGSTEKLYMWSLSPDSEGKHLIYLSADQQPADALGSVAGTLGTSADGTYVYFMQTGQIVAGEPAGSYAPNIYVWHEGEGVRYLGQTFSTEDAHEDIAGLNHFWAGLENWPQLGARVTPSGRYLLISLRSPPQGGVEPPCECFELYLYDASTEQPPICISCPENGIQPSTQTRISVRFPQGLVIPTSHLNHPMSDDGHYVFFSTGERLVPEDVNGTTDAYVYDTVKSEPRLLSSGESGSPSYFLDASSDGHDALFVTRQRLSGWDVDTNSDIYDSRVDGGIPEPEPLAPPCQGEACQPPPLTLDDPTPASATFSGPGNRHPRRRTCGQGRRSAKGRASKGGCTKKRRRVSSNEGGRYR
jgi:hypothetical protein